MLGLAALKKLRLKTVVKRCAWVIAAFGPIDAVYKFVKDADPNVDSAHLGIIQVLVNICHISGFLFGGLIEFCLLLFGVCIVFLLLLFCLLMIGVWCYMFVVGVFGGSGVPDWDDVDSAVTDIFEAILDMFGRAQTPFSFLAIAGTAIFSIYTLIVTIQEVGNPLIAPPTRFTQIDWGLTAFGAVMLSLAYVSIYRKVKEALEEAEADKVARR